MTRRGPGLQLERTSLAWRRTALSLAFNAILFLRMGMQENDLALFTTGMSLCAGAVAVVLISAKRERVLSSGYKPMSPQLMPLVAGLAALAGLVQLLTLEFP